MKNKLTQEYLKECLTYNPNTGIFTWNIRPLSHFKTKRSWNIWNSRYSNTKSGSVSKKLGYLFIGINSKSYYAHRLAFLFQEGYLPENQVDHMDRVRSNNKWDNLREVSVSCNMQNCMLAKNNTSGITGVHWDKKLNKWESRIFINSKSKRLGLFDNFEDAVRARYNEEVDNPLWTCSIDSPALKYLKEHAICEEI